MEGGSLSEPSGHPIRKLPFLHSIHYLLTVYGSTFNLRGKREKKEIHGRERRVSLVSVNFTTDIISPGKRPVVQVLCYMN